MTAQNQRIRLYNVIIWSYLLLERICVLFVLSITLNGRAKKQGRSSGFELPLLDKKFKIILQAN